jgi:hypothetical protein
LVCEALYRALFGQNTTVDPYSNSSSRVRTRAGRATIGAEEKNV